MYLTTYQKNIFSFIKINFLVINEKKLVSLCCFYLSVSVIPVSYIYIENLEHFTQFVGQYSSEDN